MMRMDTSGGETILHEAFQDEAVPGYTEDQS